MNDRIRELAVQARIQMVSEPRLQEFSELIVRDILQIINDTVNYNNCVYTTYDKNIADCTAHSLRDKIKSNFGMTQ
jgi:hypothetical protein